MRRNPVVAALALLVMLAAGCATTGSSGERRDPNLITTAEIERSTAQNVFDLVQTTRPNWLQTRGTQTFRENNNAVTSGTGRSAAVIEGTGTIVTYQDNARLGGVDALKQVPTANAGTIQFLNAGAATNRFGGGHTHGAIVVNTRR